MALDSYANLKTAIGTWTGRSDSADFADDCIDLVEAWFNRNLRVRQMLEEATATVATRLSLPTDFLEMRDLQYQGSTYRQLQYVTPERADLIDVDGTTGDPNYYTIVNNEIRIIPPPSGSSNVLMSYYQTITALSGSNTSNWLLAAYPDCYLYGALMNAAGYVNDPARLQLWEAQFSRAVNELRKEGKASMFGGSLRVRAA